MQTCLINYSENKIIDFLNGLDFHKTIKPLLFKYAKVDLLTTEAILTGGALSNIIFYLLYGIEPVINDVDVFIQSQDYTGFRSIDILANLQNSGISDNIELVPSRYGDIVASSKSYTILDTIRDDKLNVTYIGSIQKDVNLIKTVVTSFDINQTRIAFNLLDGKIFYTPDFVEYLKGKQLSITYPSTPLSSILRLLKKHEEMPYLYFDFENEMKKISFFMLDSEPEYFGFVGEATIEKFNKYIPHIEKYFDIQKIIIQGSPLLGNAKYGYTIVPLKYTSLDFIPNKVENFGEFFQAECEKIKNNPEQNLHISEPPKYHYHNNIQGSAMKWRQLFEYKSKQSLRDFYLKVYSLSSLSMLAVSSRHFFDVSNISFQKLETINNFLDEHTGFYQLIMNEFSKSEFPTLSKLVYLYDFVKSLVDKYGILAIGIVESSLSYNDVTFNNSLTYDFYSDYNNFSNFIEAETKNGDDPLCKKLPDLERFLFMLTSDSSKVFFKELTTSNELKNEGTFMHHCVGGYSNKLSRGESRIFQVFVHDIYTQKVKIRATLELSINKDKDSNTYYFSYVQCHQKFNKPIPKELEDYIKKDFIGFLNNSSDFKLLIEEQIMSSINKKPILLKNNQYYLPFFE